MVQWQLCTLEHLMNSGFGRPFPRHGLQLLFWFANNCVTCELVNFVDIMKLVSDCQPERGFYGFHLFGNVEEILPVLSRPRKCKRQYAYFEVGNLNTETYPASANLPAYVRENYGLDGKNSNCNIDRIIIHYHMRTRVVEMLFVTEHDAAAFGRFRRDRTYKISSELIQVLQSPQLDITTFLTQMGYYRDIETVQGIGGMDYPDSSAQQMFNMLQTYSGNTARTEQSADLGFFSDTFNQRLDVNLEPFSYNQVHYILNINSHNSRLVASYSAVQQKYRKPKANKRPRALRQTYWPSSWEPFYYRAFDEEAKKSSGGGGVSFFKLFLSAGALYLTARCFSWWLRSWWKGDLNENILKMMPRMSYQHPHVMLDYVY